MSDEPTGGEAAEFPSSILWRGVCLCGAELRVLVGGFVVHHEPFCRDAQERTPAYVRYLGVAVIPHLNIAGIPGMDQGRDR